MHDVSQLSDYTLKEIQEMLRWWRQTNRGGTVGDSGVRNVPPTRTVRWAQTGAVEGEEYPASGNVLPILLGEYIFDDTEANADGATFTAYAPEDGRFAFFPTGYQSEGAIVRVTLHDNMWFGPSAGGHVWHLKTPSGGVPARSGLVLGSATCDLWTVDEDDTLTEVRVAVDQIYETATREAFNKSTTAVTGSSHVLAAMDDTGRLIVIWEDCA